MSDNQGTLGILIAARELLSDGARWTKGAPP